MPSKNRTADGRKRGWYLRAQQEKAGYRNGKSGPSPLPAGYEQQHEERIVAHTARVQRDLERLGLLGRKD